LKLGAAVLPPKLPKRVPAEALLSVKERAGVVEAVATEVVNRGLSVPAENEETFPDPAALIVRVLVPSEKFTLVPAAKAKERSVPTSCLKLGVALPPDCGPQNTWPLGWLTKLIAKVPLVVIGLPETLKRVPGTVWATDCTVPTVEGRSEVCIALKVGLAAAPLDGPIQAVPLVWVVRVIDRVPELVIGEPPTLMIVAGTVWATEVTVPLVLELPAAVIVTVFPVSPMVTLLPAVKAPRISCPCMLLNAGVAEPPVAGPE
jgi:hypothetical protein